LRSLDGVGKRQVVGREIELILFAFLRRMRRRRFVTALLGIWPAGLIGRGLARPYLAGRHLVGLDQIGPFSLAIPWAAVELLDTWLRLGSLRNRLRAGPDPRKENKRERR